MTFTAGPPVGARFTNNKGTIWRVEAWPEDKDRILKELWDAGHTTKKIADMMGLTKNSVIGRAHRVGLGSRPSPIKHWEGYGPPPPPTRVLRPVTIRTHTLPPLPSLQEPSAVAVPRALTVAPRERPSRAVRAPTFKASVMPASPPAPRYGRVGECCWPGCEGTSEPGKSYCLLCCERVYVNYRSRHSAIDADAAD